MSGYFSGSTNPCFRRNRYLLKKPLSNIAFCLVILAVALFGLSGGTGDNIAEAKAKYFSGKSHHTRHARGYQRSSRKHIRGTHHKSRHYQGNRVKQRGFSNKRHGKRHGAKYRQLHTNRHGKYAYQPLHYRGPSIANVHHALSKKRLRKSRSGYRHYAYRGHHRRHHNRFSRLVVTHNAPAPQTKLYRHVERDDATGISVIYFDKKKCDQGYHCVMRLGGKRSSAKIIVVGTKQEDRFGAHDLPRIIYPPN